MSGAAVQDLCYRECGLKALSGISNDMRELLDASADPKAEFALDYFSYRVGLYTGMLTAALGGLDAFVFTAGIGGNSAGCPRPRCREISVAGCCARSVRQCGGRPIDILAPTAASPFMLSPPTRN